MDDYGLIEYEKHTTLLSNDKYVNLLNEKRNIEERLEVIDREIMEMKKTISVSVHYPTIHR
jgi:hypothetical protein